MNYRPGFAAWDWGGFGLSLRAGMVYGRAQSFAFVRYCSAGLLVAASVMAFLVKPPHAKAAPI